MCKYEEYSGNCKNPGDPWCENHAKARCFACGEQATKGCTYEGMLVCGEYECDKHSHIEMRHMPADEKYLKEHARR